ncbi:MAG: peptidylprolyl isomerase [Lachnospiraceae bacterium]|jgi:peptidyl-prolyl cis-trans isomerase B (cyclophilin B)|nr:peptidylprolyl isomerase [Lachnospiraceae bacterium]
MGFEDNEKYDSADGETGERPDRTHDLGDGENNKGKVAAIFDAVRRRVDSKADESHKDADVADREDVDEDEEDEPFGPKELLAYIKGLGKVKLAAIVAVAVLVLAGGVFAGFQAAQSRQYVTTATDIADRFPLKAEDVGANPQLVGSDGPYAILHTTAGDITMILYPDQAPKAVENFIELAKRGYYDGSAFYFVKKDQYAELGKPVAGNPATTTTPPADGEEAKYGDEISSFEGGLPFPDEFHDGLHNFNGAVGMVNDAYNMNYSRFYYVVSDAKTENGDDVAMSIYYNELTRNLIDTYQAEHPVRPTDEELAEFQDELNAKLQGIATDGVPQETYDRYASAIERYKEVGGIWSLDHRYTVFGQIVRGLNVAKAATEVLVDPNTRTPKKELAILSVEIVDSLE